MFLRRTETPCFELLRDWHSSRIHCFNVMSIAGSMGIRQSSTGRIIQQEAEVMLMLTRRAMETIRIGDNIVIRVNRVGRQQVSLGIEAPPELLVLRGELQRLADGSSAGTGSSSGTTAVAAAPEAFRVSA
jgi:carbon storage regulator